MIDINEFGHFVVKHWELWTLLGIILILLLIEEQKAQSSAWGAVSTQQAVNLINHEHALVIDIRDQASFDTGHILNATNIPADQLQDHYKDLEKHKDKPIILTCDSGHSCVSAAGKLQKAGFAKASLLKGGIAQWRKDSLPIVKK